MLTEIGGCTRFREKLCVSCGRSTWNNVASEDTDFHGFYRAKVALAVIYVGYTYPITASATLGSNSFAELLPTLNLESDELFGFLRAQLLNLFLA